MGSDTLRWIVHKESQQELDCIFREPVEQIGKRTKLNKQSKLVLPQTAFKASRVLFLGLRHRPGRELSDSWPRNRIRVTKQFVD